MAKRPRPCFRVTIVLQYESEITSLVVFDDSIFALFGLNQLEATTPLRLLEAHVTRIEAPNPVRQLSQRR